MKRVTIRCRDGFARTYATNDSGDGLFVYHESSYKQLAGNCQFHANNYRQFRRFLAKRELTSGGRVIAAWGWDR